MINKSRFWLSGMITAAALLSTGSTALVAAPMLLTYTGVFNSRDALNLASQSNPSYFTGATPFTINAIFDPNSPDLAPTSPPAPPPFGGFVAYSPSQATITIAGTTYSIDAFNANPGAGVTVAIFDQNSFTPGHYAIGILAQPPQDGAGIIGDFSSASPNFTAHNIVPTTFTQYYGVGYGSGVCTQGTGGDCSQNAITPLVLHNGGQTYSLTLGNYDEDYPVVHDPTMPASVGLLNTAQLTSIPEPATFGLMGFAIVGLAGLAARRRT